MSHKLEVDSIHLEVARRSLLTSVYLKCESGKITALLGRNGSGKSTLLKVIFGSLSSEGSIRINGTNIRNWNSTGQLISYLPQSNFIPKQLSLSRIFKDFNLNFSEFITKFPEFSHSYLTSIGELSGGGTRIVETYVIVKSNSLFVLLDEPFTHLSPIQIATIKAILIEEKKSKGILITDHMYHEVLELSDNIYLLSDGKTIPITDFSELQHIGYISPNTPI